MRATEVARPPNAGKGRKKGVPNKINSDLRAMIHGALEEAGGQTYLATQAKENPAAFLSLLGKTLPKEITGPQGEPIKFLDMSAPEQGRQLAAALAKLVHRSGAAA